MTSKLAALAATAAITGLAALSSGAQAETRRFGLVSFDRVDVAGDISVDIVDDYRIGAIAEGSRAAVETVSLTIDNRTLYIRIALDGPFGARPADAGPVQVRLTAQNLAGIAVHGSGQVTVRGMRAMAVDATLDGGGSLTVTGIDARDVRTRNQGSGTVTLSGRSLTVNAAAGGAGRIDASGLAAQTLVVRIGGTNASSFAASRTAEVTTAGAAGVTVTGRPRCTVRNLGSGTVICGADVATRLPRADD